MGDHDSLFKRAFSVPAHAAGELRTVLPAALVDRLDLDRLELVPGSFVDAEMKERHTDLLFRAPLAEGSCYLYVLIEHQSKADPFMPLRALGYLCRIWDAVRRGDKDATTLPPIVTVVVHHGKEPWSEALRLHELIDGLDTAPELRELVPDLPLLLDDLTIEADEALQRRPLQPLPKTALWLLRDGRDIERLLSHLAAWAAELAKLVRDDPGGEDALFVMSYILRVAGEVPYEIILERVVDIAPATEEPMASAAEQLIQEGMEKGKALGMEKGEALGMEKGKALGRQEGEAVGMQKTLRHTLARQLRARFGAGALDASVLARIDQASVEELDRWIERVVTVAELHEVFAP